MKISIIDIIKVEYNRQKSNLLITLGVISLYTIISFLVIFFNPDTLTDLTYIKLLVTNILFLILGTINTFDDDIKSGWALKILKSKSNEKYILIKFLSAIEGICLPLYLINFILCYFMLNNDPDLNNYLKLLIVASGSITAIIFLVAIHIYGHSILRIIASLFMVLLFAMPFMLKAFPFHRGEVGYGIIGIPTELRTLAILYLATGIIGVFALFKRYVKRNI